MIDKSKFANKQDLIKHVVANKSELTSLKKSVTKFSDCILHDDTFKIEANKVISNFSSDDLVNGIIKRTIVGNTYGWMDSHDDVHIKGIFTKSISENKDSQFHLHDHLYQLAAKVGTPIKIYEQNINVTDLGLNKIGFATCLLMDTEIKKSYNAMIFEEYLTKQINQHSVGMVYVKLYLCVNDAEYKEEFANWNTYKGSVINLDKAEENGYFWAVTEAKLKEISCVLLGSNELTPTLNGKSEPLTSTHKNNEPDKATQQKQKLSINQSIY
ncbi:MAG: hypothetical protein V4538_15545 [Bacteroidota bacterium]